MEFKEKIRINICFFLEIFSLSLFFSTLTALKKINFLNRFQPLLKPFTIIFFLLLFLFYLFRKSSFKKYFLNYSLPLLLFLAIVPMLVFYINGRDFIGRIYNLLVLFFILEVYIFLKNNKKLLQKILNVFTNLNKNSLLFISLAILFILILIFTLRNPYLSGDEPHYYVISASIVQDGDFELRNNYSTRDYKYVNPTVIAPHCHEGKNGGWFSFHLPGISLLIAPLFPLTKIIPSPWNVLLLRMFLSLSGILFSFQILRFTKREGFEREIYIPIYFISLFLPPFFFHSFHLYTEMLCAFIGIFIINEIIEEKIGRIRGFLDGILFGFVLFMNQKYYPILVLIFLFYFYTLLKKKNSFKGFPAFIIPVFSIFALLIFYVWSTFGVLSPFSVRKEVSTLSGISAFFKGFEPLYFLESFLDYFLDQRDGLLLYAPFLLFSFFGLIEMGKRNKRLLLILLSISLPYVLLYAWNLTRGGYSPFSRPLMAISWIFPIGLAYFLESNRKGFLKDLFLLFFSLTLLFEFFLIKYPQFLYQPTTSGITQRAGDLFLYLSNLYLNLPSFLPSFIKIPNLKYMPNYFWIIFLILFLIFYKKLKGLKGLRGILTFGFSIFFIVTLVLFPRLRFTRAQELEIGTLEATFFSLSRNIHISNNEFFVMRDDRYYIPFLTKEKLGRIVFSFHSEDYFDISLQIFDIPFLNGTYMIGSAFYENPPYFNYMGKKLYFLDLKIKNKRWRNQRYSPFYWKIEAY